MLIVIYIKGYTISEIGSLLGVSRQWINVKVDNALNVVRTGEMIASGKRLNKDRVEHNTEFSILKEQLKRELYIIIDWG